jgi:hypothetical protein
VAPREVRKGIATRMHNRAAMMDYRMIGSWGGEHLSEITWRRLSNEADYVEADAETAKNLASETRDAMHMWHGCTSKKL